MEKAIAEFILRSALIGVCTGAALFLFRVKAARARHAVWAGVMAVMLLLPAWTAWGPKAALPLLTAAAARPPVQTTAVLQGSMDAAPAAPLPAPRRTWENALLALYLAGFGLLMLRLATGAFRARRLARRAENREGRLTSAACAAPVTVGWWRPSVILPASWPQWTPSQLSAVLAHEQEHARWRDPLTQWLALLNRALFWFHPLSWWLEIRLSGLAEEACDDAVLMRGHDPLEYSEYLLGLARAVRDAGARVDLMGMAMPGTFLPRRIRRIAAGVTAQRIPRWRLISIAGAFAIVSTVFTAGTIGYSAPAPGAETGQSISGTVLDPSNAVIFNALVVLRDQATGVEIFTETNHIGVYKLEGFEPGVYELSVLVPGFRALRQAGISIAAGQARDEGKMFLQLGSVAESVSVAGSRSAPVASAATPVSAPPPPPPVPAPSAAGGPVRVGGSVQPVSLLKYVKPVYPAALQRAGVAGSVRMEAVISKDGEPRDVKVISSPDPALTQAALEAVSQWQYRPTRLNGEPVEVLTAIQMNFSLTD